MRAFHNSREGAYRSPFGALKTGEEVTLAIDIFEADNAVCRCRIWADGVGERFFEMEKAEKDGFLRFSCNFIWDSPAILWYSFIIECDGKMMRYGAQEGKTGGEGMLYPHEPPSFQITVFDERKVPDWYKNAIVYQIFPDRFCRGDDWRELCEKALSERRNGPGRSLVEDWNTPPRYRKDPQGRIADWDFYGGTLSGIEKKLPYLKQLGISVIYLNPIFSAASNHRYDTGNYLEVDPMLGGDKAFASLCKKAEEYGISLILDGVFNHTGCDSIYFDRYRNYNGEGAYRNENSPYRSWFNFNSDGSYGCWWGIDDLPDINENDPAYREFICGKDGVVQKWLKMGAKGWRLDVADELPDDFIADIKSAVLDVDSENGLLMGEVWEDASNKISYGKLRRYFLGNELDCTMNYPFRDIMLDFLLERISAKNAAERFYSLYENYPKEAFYSALNLAGSHDRPRILTVLGGSPEQDSLNDEQRFNHRLTDEQKKLARNRLWLMVLAQMTFPGVPCVYYGDEAGLEGYSDPYNRAAYPWGNEDKDIGSIFRNSIALRKLLPLFTEGDITPLSPADEVFGYSRALGDESAIVLLNRDIWSGHTVTVPHLGGAAFELINDQPFTTENDEITITLPPLGSAVIYFCRDEKLAMPIAKGSGVLCHFTSLYNKNEAGNIGAPALDFADRLADANQKYWQILPTNPTDEYGSPYAGSSAFAGNPDLIETGGKTLEQLFEAFTPDGDYKKFCKQNADWLEPYAAFMAIKEQHPERWQLWTEELKSYSPELIKRGKLAARAKYYRFVQYLFDCQWKTLKAKTAEKGISIIGDMPMYVSEDSADVWAHREMFCLDEAGNATDVAGVPPDYFCEEGQHWGNPLYNWDKIAESGYEWWINRLKRAFYLYDYVRLDHFRGFEAYWAIPQGKKSLFGRWLPGPGYQLFDAAYKALGKLPIIAEDLGVITPGVRALMFRCGFCGMSVIQFSDNDPFNDYSCGENRLAYTGTHDNQTLLGWCIEQFPNESLEEQQKKALSLMENVAKSDAPIAIFPLQDVLLLDNNARMNTPGNPLGNWKWRSPRLTKKNFEYIAKLAKKSGRA